MTSFFKNEAKGLASSFWTPFWRTTLIAALILGTWLVCRMWTSPPEANGAAVPASFGTYLIEGVLIYGFALVYAAPVGILVGSFAASWRLFGGWTLLPVFLFPLILWGFFWLAGDFLLAQGRDIPEALNAAFQARGLPMTSGLFRSGAGGAVHAGPVAVVLLILLIPPLVIDSMHLLLDPAVLGQLFEFLLSLSLVALAGLFLSTLISSIFLIRAFVKRLKARRSEFLDLKAPPSVPS